MENSSRGIQNSTLLEKKIILKWLYKLSVGRRTVPLKGELQEIQSQIEVHAM